MVVATVAFGMGIDRGGERAFSIPLILYVYPTLAVGCRREAGTALEPTQDSRRILPRVWARRKGRKAEPQRGSVLEEGQVNARVLLKPVRGGWDWQTGEAYPPTNRATGL